MKQTEPMSSEPKCEKCGASGAGTQFNIFGPFEFGKFCVPCEKEAIAKWGGPTDVKEREATQ